MFCTSYTWKFVFVLYRWFFISALWHSIRCFFVFKRFCRCTCTCRCRRRCRFRKMGLVWLSFGCLHWHFITLVNEVESNYHFYCLKQLLSRLPTLALQFFLTLRFYHLQLFHNCDPCAKTQDTLWDTRNSSFYIVHNYLLK